VDSNAFLFGQVAERGGLQKNNRCSASAQVEKALGDATVHRSFFGVPHHRHIHACTSKVDLSIGSIHSKAFMSDQKTAHEKISALGASISSNVNEALQSAQPAMNRMSHRVKDELHDLEESGKDAYSDAKHKLEKEAHHVRVTTEHLIQHSPFNAVLIAAGTGAVAALAVSWFLRSRQH
jgi:ElaB/YqjD/DUF883 family membrane-anchored ribosome-binding protein